MFLGFSCSSSFPCFSRRSLRNEALPTYSLLFKEKSALTISTRSERSCGLLAEQMRKGVDFLLRGGGKVPQLDLAPYEHGSKSRKKSEDLSIFVNFFSLLFFCFAFGILNDTFNRFLGFSLTAVFLIPFVCVCVSVSVSHPVHLRPSESDGRRRFCQRAYLSVPK